MWCYLLRPHLGNSDLIPISVPRFFGLDRIEGQIPAADLILLPSYSVCSGSTEGPSSLQDVQRPAEIKACSGPSEWTAEKRLSPCRSIKAFTRSRI